MRTFGETLKKHRTLVRMTQAELATKMGVTPQTISQYERGLKNPKHKTVEKYARALGCKPGEIYSMYIESEGKSKMSEEMSLPNNWDGELKILILKIALQFLLSLSKMAMMWASTSAKKTRTVKHWIIFCILPRLMETLHQSEAANAE